MERSDTGSVLKGASLATTGQGNGGVGSRLLFLSIAWANAFLRRFFEAVLLAVDDPEALDFSDLSDILSRCLGALQKNKKINFCRAVVGLYVESALFNRFCPKDVNSENQMFVRAAEVEISRKWTFQDGAQDGVWMSATCVSLELVVLESWDFQQNAQLIKARPNPRNVEQ